MTQSRRSPSSPHKQKSSRPILHRRGTSGANLSISKLGSVFSISGEFFPFLISYLGPKTSFTPYSYIPLLVNTDFLISAMCERQITVPNNSILYCSESCRRKDSCKPLSASLPSISKMSTISTTPPTSPPLSPRTIVAPMTPTRGLGHSVPSIRIPGYTHHAKTDLDPTEWKPVIRPGLMTSSSVATSDAWNYLSKFHGGAESLLHRPTSVRSNSLPVLAGHGDAHVPSLTHTPGPSTVASSCSSTASDYLGNYEASFQRPSAPRYNPPFYNAGAKSVEFVVPHVAEPENEVSDDVLFATADWEDAPSPYKSAPISMMRPVGRS
ncbi:hypothetical protein N7495_006194 [Penicillium taxi]|uniref:uncharacterized protein n=1 Tax=Penicillium taxi TaxID=168475 RepID=UPI0025452A14|nr:uncharacterized protein N7495_006194 [Penicillium taxi]KAJ5894503.1 hypothetical protein N7495_006194 [Penicillium taxi]